MLSPVSMASVSSVHFGDNALDRPGAYAKPAQEAAPVAAPVEEKSGSSAGKKVAIGAGIIIAALATLVGLTRGKVLTKLDEAALKDAKWYGLDKMKHYLAVAGDTIAKYTYDPIAKLFNSKKTAEVADDFVEVVEEAAEGAAKA